MKNRNDPVCLTRPLSIMMLETTMMMMLGSTMMAIGYHLWRGERVCGGALHHLLRALRRGRRGRRVRFQVRARVAFNVVVKSRPSPVVGFGGL